MIDEVTTEYCGAMSREFLEFARRQLVNATMYKGSEKRGEDRHPMMLPVLMVEIDEDNSPKGEVFEAVTRDIAESSIGLFHENCLGRSRYSLQMDMAGVEVNLVVKLIWTGPMGPFFGSAGWFEKRSSKFAGAEIASGSLTDCNLNLDLATSE